MKKSNLELFKQAISEGLSNKFDSIVNSYSEEIVCSEKHELAMRTIVHGKIGTKRIHSPKMKQIIAILVAATLILTSCGIIFRNEIRKIFEDICDFFVALTYTEKDSEGSTIEEIYELSYLPDGYYLDEEKITALSVYYSFLNENSDYIWFEQKLLDGTDFVLDNESGYSEIISTQKYEIYYMNTNVKHFYIWNDGKYSIKLSSNTKLSDDEIILLFEGMKIK